VHKLDVLRAHCEAVGRDYDAIEKTTLFAMNPETTTDDILRMAEPMQDLGFSTAYIFAQRMPDPGKIIDVIHRPSPHCADQSESTAPAACR
jgi:hypothetical protein